MDTDGSSSVAEVDLDHVDLDSWFATFPVDNSDGFVMNSSSVDATTMNPNYPCQPSMSAINDCTNLGEGSSNMSQYGIVQEMVPVSNLAPSNYINTMQFEEMVPMGGLTPSNNIHTMHSDDMMLASSLVPSSYINTMQTGEMTTANGLALSSYINTMQTSEMTTANGLALSSYINTMQSGEMMTTANGLALSSYTNTMQTSEMTTVSSLALSSYTNTMQSGEMMTTANGLALSSYTNTMQSGEMMTLSNINTPQTGEMVTMSMLTPSSSTSTTQNEGILSSAVKYISNISGQSSQPQTNTNLPQYLLTPPAQEPQCQLLLQQVLKGKAVQQPTTCSLANQSNMTFGDQNNQLHYQMPSNQLVPFTGPTVNTQMGNLQIDQALMVQIQQNLNQKQLQLQQATAGRSGNLISEGGRQLGNFLNLNLSAPVGFASPSQFPTRACFRVYALRQIRKLKERYFNELLKMHYNAMEFRTRATTMEGKISYEKVQTYLERMMTFLNINRVEMIPKNEGMVYNYMNTIVNYMSYHMNRPAHQPLRGPQVQPIGTMNLQHNTSLNLSQSITNLEASMSNFNQNFPSRRPQPTLQRMPSSLNSTSFQTGIDQRSDNLLSGSFEAPQPSVLKTTEQVNSGPNTSSIIGPGSPINLFSQTTATNFPSRPLNHQPPVTNQNLNLEKMKAPMQNTSNPTGSKARHGMSPLSSGMVNECPSPRFSVPSTVNPTTQQTPESSSRLDVTISSLSTVDSQKTKPPMDPPSEEPKTSKDQVLHLAELVKSVSSNALGSTITEMSSIEKVTGRDIGSADTSTNKRKKIEHKWEIFEEIKEINNKLLETSIHVVTDTSVETTVKCLFKNVCFPDFLGPQGGDTSEKMPEFAILFLVPSNYPASSPRIIKPSDNVLNEPWEKLYEEMLMKFNHWLGGVTGILSLGDMARNWDASARAVMTEFIKERDGKNFSSMYGSWDDCINSSPTSN